MNRKGITPVVATVLLLTISVAATASAYTFIRETQQQTAENFEEQITREERQRQSDMNIEFVYNSTKGNHTLMNIRNTGSVSLRLKDDGEKVLSVYADGRPVNSGSGNGKGWEFTSDKFKSASTVILDPSQTFELNTTVSYPAEGGDKQFKVVGEYGVSDSYFCINSGSASC